MALDYFTLAEFRALPDMADDGKFPDARVAAAGEYTQGVIESAVGTSFTARTVIETLDTVGNSQVVLSTPYVLGVSSVVIDGIASTDVFTVKAGVLHRAAAGARHTPLAWGDGRRNLTVTYSAGYSTSPPADVKQAAMQGTRAYLLATGHPQVDALVARWQLRLTTESEE